MDSALRASLRQSKITPGDFVAALTPTYQGYPGQRKAACHSLNLRRAACGDALDFFSHALFRVPQIVSRLKMQPKLRPVTTELAEPYGHLGGDGHRTGQDTVQGLAADAQRPRRFGHIQAEGRQHILPQNFARVHGRYFRGFGKRIFFRFRH